MVKNAIASPARRRKKATMTIQSLRRMSGRLGLTGYLVAFLGTLLVAGDWWFESFVAPRIAAVAPEVMSGTTTGSLAVGAAATFGLFALGWTIFGIATFRAKVYPRSAAVLLTIGGVTGILALTTPFQVPLAIAIGWTGYTLYRSDRADVSESPVHDQIPGEAVLLSARKPV